MKISKSLLFAALAFLSLAFSPADAGAQPPGATHFVGLYEILTPPPPEGQQHYLLVDNDMLGIIWDRYSEEPLPTELEPYRYQYVILAGFTIRDFLILTFEQSSQITLRYLQLQAGESDLLELYRRDDGQYDLGTRENGQVQIYLTRAPISLPEMGKKTIRINSLVSFGAL